MIAAAPGIAIGKTFWYHPEKLMVEAGNLIHNKNRSGLKKLVK